MAHTLLDTVICNTESFNAHSFPPHSLMLEPSFNAQLARFLSNEPQLLQRLDPPHHDAQQSQRLRQAASNEDLLMPAMKSQRSEAEKSDAAPSAHSNPRGSNYQPRAIVGRTESQRIVLSRAVKYPDPETISYQIQKDSCFALVCFGAPFHEQLCRFIHDPHGPSTNIQRTLDF